MIRLRPLVALLLSLLLLGAQQVAFAHMIGHIGPTNAVITTAHQGDEGHGEALTLSHVCTTCVSASGLASAVPLAVPPRLTFDGAFLAPMASSTSVIAAVVPRHYLARAPPTVL